MKERAGTKTVPALLLKSFRKNNLAPYYPFPIPIPYSLFTIYYCRFTLKLQATFFGVAPKFITTLKLPSINPPTVVLNAV